MRRCARSASRCSRPTSTSKSSKRFTKTLKERCLGDEVLKSLDPGQQVVKIVNEELATLMGGTGRELAMANSGPTVILMAGLQGSGKTTACAKLAHVPRRRTARTSRSPPATSTGPPRSTSWSRSASAPAPTSTSRAPTRDPVEIAEWALQQARTERRDVLIVDTAGRLHIDQDLMAELAQDPQEDAARTTSCWSSTR